MQLAVPSVLKSIPLTKSALAKNYLSAEYVGVFERTVLSMAPACAVNYKGSCKWEYMVVGNGAIYIRPGTKPPVFKKFDLAGGCLVSADAFGLIVTLLAFNDVLKKKPNEVTAHLFDDLLEFVDQHSEAREILNTIDGVF